MLQPMTSQPDLRQWLFKNGYCILNERNAREGDKLYTVLLVKAGKMDELTPAELWAGKQNNDPLRGEYLDHIIKKVWKALEGQRSAARRDERSILYLELVLSGLKTMKEEWNAWQR